MGARSRTGAGFTIVETLIFLAISGLMLALAVTSMEGKEQQTEFDTGVDTLKSDLNEQMSSVSDGNYLALGNTNCTTNGGAVPVFVTASTPPDGSCTVIGEVIAFTTNTTPETFSVLPVIGRNYITGTTSTPATTITQAVPQISTSYTKYAQTITMPFGLTLGNNFGLTTIKPNGSAGSGAIGLFTFTSFEGGANGSSGALNSGASHVELFVVPDSLTTETAATLAGYVNGVGLNSGLDNCPTDAAEVCIGNNSSSAEPINPPSGITFCANSGQDSYSALFTLGGSNSPDSLTDTIYDRLNCTN